MTLLPFIQAVDLFPYNDTEGFTELIAHDGTTIGLINDSIAAKFKNYDFDFKQNKIIIKQKYDTIEKRSELFAKVASEWRLLPEFSELLDKGWRDELYIVYNPSQTPYLYLERAFSVSIGVVTYGVHVNGYVRMKDTIKLWIPRRSATKPTFPNMLDNTVGGGLGYPYGLEETLIKECFEEAGLDEPLVKSNSNSAGVISYLYLTEGRVQPEVEYIYDIEIPETIKPNPQDGEAVDYQLLSINEVLTEIKDNKFKPNCALVIIDFLIRFGYITAENEPNYLEIVSRCHRRIPFPTR